MWLKNKWEQFKKEKNLQSRNFPYFFSGDREAEEKNETHSRKFNSRWYSGANGMEHDHF